MSTDTFELVGEDDNDVSGHTNSHDSDPRNDSGGAHSPFTPRSGSATPSEEGDQVFPCPHCPDKRFGNRRNLMSHMRRHTGDYKLFCESCGKGFFTQSKLDSHKRKHTGEKPFRCLFKTCLKRFRYKGDLSKHIKRYHPGHTQDLTPVPLQEDELAALENAQQTAIQKTITIATSSANTETSTLRTVLTAGIRPTNKLIMSTMQPPVSCSTTNYLSQNANSNPGTIIPDADPSLDENLLNMLAADGDDDHMLSPTAHSLAGLSTSTNSSIDTSLVLPNTVFSSKPVNQDVGFLQLMSSGKSTTTTSVSSQSSEPCAKQVFFHIADGSGSIQRPVLKGKNAPTTFAQPQSSQPNLKAGITLSVTSTTSSQTLRTLLSSSLTTSHEGKTVRMPLSKSPASVSDYVKVSATTPSMSNINNTSLTTSSPILQSTSVGGPVNGNLLSTTFIPSKNSHRPVNNQPVLLTQSYSSSVATSSSMTESFLPADISFTSESSRESLNGLPSDAVTLSLEDLLAYARMPTKSETVKSDRESDLTSPGSVRSTVSEIESNVSRSEESDAVVVDKLACHYPGCSKTFERANLLKRHLKMHSGECRFVCDVCKKCFESNSKLEDHYRRHTGERPFQCQVCGNKFRYKGDRTKHLKNLHGIHKSQEQQNQSIVNNSSATVPNGNVEMYSPPSSSQSQGPSPTSNLVDKTPFLPSITEETCSSISSFQSNPEMSDAASASGSIIGESPNKFDPLDVGVPVSQQTTPATVTVPSTPISRPTVTVSLPTNGLPFPHPSETVTMSIEEVIQYAQPIADFTF